MTLLVERNQDPALALPIERLVAPRPLSEVARRYALADGWLARVDGHVAGAATLATYRGADDAPAFAWVGGMGVAPEHRRKGVARALLRAATARAEEIGVPSLGLDATDAGRPLYESEGFRAVARTSRWVRPAARHESTPSARHAVHPISISEAVEISAYDLPRFGARRMPLLMALLHDRPWHAFMARDRATGDVTGFAFGNERGIGPLVADDVDAAATLLAASERAGAPCAVLVRDDDADVTKALRDAGYAPDGVACTRMGRGRELPRQRGVRALATWALG